MLSTIRIEEMLQLGFDIDRAVFLTLSLKCLLASSEVSLDGTESKAESPVWEASGESS